jgi:hypothetical protein
MNAPTSPQPQADQVTMFVRIDNIIGSVQKEIEHCARMVKRLREQLPALALDLPLPKRS